MVGFVGDEVQNGCKFGGEFIVFNKWMVSVGWCWEVVYISICCQFIVDVKVGIICIINVVDGYEIRCIWEDGNVLGIIGKCIIDIRL